MTGKDTDRLPEEQERGISIDLGYAPLDLGDGRRASLIDVPGHERLVRTMIAGATGIDLFLLVLDAQEGARPQTHEHLAVLRLLGVDRGVVAVTKADAVDDETLQLAVDEARELVPGAEVVPVSAKTGAGLDELRAALARVAVDERDEGGGTRLYVDRSFSLPGIGTVATGTLWSGRVAAGDVLRLEPAGRIVRVRSVQVHDTAVDEAEPGQRVAVNLPTLERSEVGRGDVLVAPGHYPVTYRLDVKLAGTPDLPAAATVHIGTNAVPARIARDGEYAQLRLVTPVVAARGDRVVLRTETTVGGGVVLDPSPPRRLVREQLQLLDGGSPEEILAALVHEPVTGRELQARGILPPAELALGLASLAGCRRARVLGGVARRPARRRARTARRARPHEPARSGAAARRAPPQRAVGAARPEPARDRAPRREGVPAGCERGARRARRCRGRARTAAQPRGDRQGRRQAARGLPRG